MFLNGDIKIVSCIFKSVRIFIWQYSSVYIDMYKFPFRIFSYNIKFHMLEQKCLCSNVQIFTAIKFPIKISISI